MSVVMQSLVIILKVPIKATIVARGGSLGATFMVPNESDSLSLTKEKVLA